jgi:hypothetical protein
VKHLVVLVTACRAAQSAPELGARDTPAARAHAPVTSVATPPSIGDATVTRAITSVHIVASIDGAGASDRPVYARADQHVTLHVMLRAGTAYYSDAPSPRLAGKAITATPLASAPSATLAWHRIEPAAANVSNTASGSFRFEPIDYRTTAIEGAHAGALAADVRPTLTPDHGDGVGTMRYQLVVTQGDRVLVTAGPSARRGGGSGGLTDAVMRVTLRRDDTFLGYLTEMYGQPYIWASAGKAKAHQSERLEGSDCADLMVYGARRMGKDLAYTWTGGLPQVTTLVASGDRDDKGVFRDREGKALAFTQIGDLVLFPPSKTIAHGHVGALAADRGTPGVLDEEDLIVHTLLDSPKQESIAKSGWAAYHLELRRWR